MKQVGIIIVGRDVASVHSSPAAAMTEFESKVRDFEENKWHKNGRPSFRSDGVTQWMRRGKGKDEKKMAVSCVLAIVRD